MTESRSIRGFVGFGLASALSVALFGCPATDGDNNMDTNEPMEQTQPVNHAPLANAGDDVTIASGEQVILNGSGVTDPDGDRVVYIWRQIAGPRVDLADVGSSRPRFFAPTPLAEATTITFRLTVTDGIASAADDVSVTVQP